MPEPLPSDPRLALAHAWLAETLGAGYSLAPASSDASFRRYFRVSRGDESWILMDAPPEREDSRPFVEIAARLREAGVTVPRVLAANLDLGFLWLTDLGVTHYLAALTPGSRDRLYGDALGALLTMQTRVAPAGLPGYDQRLLRLELGLFREWYLGRHLGMSLGARAAEALAGVEDRLVAAALAQPRCFVHRDYHSRNLMVLERGNPGVLDFQGAVHGPLTYDLVSLLRDCYIAWPEDYVREAALRHLQALRGAGLAQGVAPAQFLEWLDLMGVQRHLKAIGIFARLYHRDGKPHYLDDIPRTLGYVRQVSTRRAALGPLADLIEGLGPDPGQPPADAGAMPAGLANAR